MTNATLSLRCPECEAVNTFPNPGATFVHAVCPDCGERFPIKGHFVKSCAYCDDRPATCKTPGHDDTCDVCYSEGKHACEVCHNDWIAATVNGKDVCEKCSDAFSKIPGHYDPTCDDEYSCDNACGEMVPVSAKDVEGRLLCPDCRQNWIVAPCGQNRDSDTLTQSNFAACLKSLGGEGLPPSLASLVATVAVESVDPESFARDYFPGSFRDPQ